ncbi:MAG TPA: efflux RND transporter periplasmic adaptor subunit, partial [Streptosporangiaceae bacterium]|nr:efflux RND transporter periplasmic adaptor subunit [Streptosporangiaceae bacterium]
MKGWAALGIVVVVAAVGAVSAWRAGALSPAASSGSGSPGASAPATQAVIRRHITATTPLAGSLGYAGSYTVRGQEPGKLTWLPAPGTVIRQGRVLYRINNGSPVLLLHGRVPAWRALAEGVTGADVAQLN